MEVKPGPAPNSRKKLFQKIQKAAASGISFQNPDPFSPRKDIKSHLKTHHHHHHNRGFSGPIIIPEGKRNNPTTNKFDVDVAIEPTSPKISCMGQIIKQKKKNIISKKKTAPPPPSKQENHPVSDFNSPRSGFWTSRTIYKTERPIVVEKGSKKRGKDFGEAAEPPRLGQLKKYASVRETLSNFDWKTATATATENGEVEEEEDEVIIPFSAPLIMGGGIGNKPKPIVELERKKEINLWKRRTMAQPSSLHLNSVSVCH